MTVPAETPLVLATSFADAERGNIAGSQLTRRDTREEEQQTRQMLRGQRPLRKRSQQRFPSV
jgi:hypothetical protein